MKDEQFWDHIFEQIAEGVNLPALARGPRFPTGPTRTSPRIPSGTRNTSRPDTHKQHGRKPRSTRSQTEWNQESSNLKQPKVSLDARKWLASRQNPQVYGERTQHDVKIQSIHTLHLEAHADLAQRMKQIPDQGETIEHEEGC